MTDRPTLWGPGEIARAYGVNPSTVRRWRAEPGFPEPQQLIQGPVWHAQDVRSWRATQIAIMRRRRAF